ncbi:MAG: DUF4296 domain-containing protein [Bacteroidota bacterium]
MNRFLQQILIILAIILLIAACDKPVVKKPKKLVSRDKMVEMLTDMHIAESVFQNRRYTGSQPFSFTEADFYYSILKKHQVADSVFELSLIYYSSLPKEFEKIYSRVLNRLNEMEQEQLEKQQQPVDIGTERR